MLGILIPPSRDKRERRDIDFDGFANLRFDSIQPLVEHLETPSEL